MKPQEYKVPTYFIYVAEITWMPIKSPNIFIKIKNIKSSNNLFVTLLEGSVAPVSAQLQFLKFVSTWL